jgi:hypothetical protein
MNVFEISSDLSQFRQFLGYNEVYLKRLFCLRCDGDCLKKGKPGLFGWIFVFDDL